MRGHRTDLLISLTQSDLRARYGRGPWQLIKWLLDPFALVGVYLILITAVLDRPGEAPGLALTCAVLPFQILTLTTTSSMTAVTLRRGIIANMSFPRSFLPLGTTLTETLAFAASFLLVVIMMLIYSVSPTTAILSLPLMLAVNLALAVSFAYAATLFGVWVPDLRPFALSLVRAMFFLAPGLIALDQIEGPANTWVRVNPFSGLFEGYRAIFLRGELPDPWMVLIPLGWACLLAAVFLPIYLREQGHFAKVAE